MKRKTIAFLALALITSTLQSCTESSEQEVVSVMENDLDKFNEVNATLIGEHDVTEDEEDDVN